MKKKKKRTPGRPKEEPFDSVIRVPIDGAMRDQFHALCISHKPRVPMTKAIRHFMKLCIINKTILGMNVEK